MKIVHISDSYRGGAGIAAFRIHKALLKNGVDSHFICQDKHLPDSSMSNLQYLEKEVKKSKLFDIIIDKIKWRLNHHLKINLNSQRDKISKKFATLSSALKCETSSLPFSEYDLLEDPFVKNADIIHLHWAKGLIDYPTFFKKSEKPVIWTLHDMNPLQGIFHYKEDEVINAAIASSLDRQVIKLKSSSIKKRKSALGLVAPSKWLLETAIQSKVFKNVPGYYIPYPLDTQIFRPEKNDLLKTSLNILPGHTVFLFIAQKTDNRRKGFDLLIEALKKLNQKNITLLVIGNSERMNISDAQVILLGTIEDKQTLSNYYSIADAFILPSREDNLPNVMLESLACGTPVISFDIGGMAEIIKNDFNGFKAKGLESNDLANVLIDFIETKKKFNKDAIRNFALENFSERLIAEKYKDVYKRILEA